MAERGGSCSSTTGSTRELADMTATTTGDEVFASRARSAPSAARRSRCSATARRRRHVRGHADHRWGPIRSASAAAAPSDGAFAAYDASQDSLRVANAPEPVDLFEPFDCPRPNEYRTASGRPGPGLLAAARRLRPDGDAGRRRRHAHRDRPAALHQQQPGGARLPLVPPRAEPVRDRSRGGPITGRAERSLDDAHGYRLGADHRRRPPGDARRQRHADAARPGRAARRRRRHRSRS